LNAFIIFKTTGNYCPQYNAGFKRTNHIITKMLESTPQSLSLVGGGVRKINFTIKDFIYAKENVKFLSPT